jgi:hypothetical protein
MMRLAAVAVAMALGFTACAHAEDVDPAGFAGEFLAQFKAIAGQNEADIAEMRARFVLAQRELSAAKRELEELKAKSPPACKAPATEPNHPSGD